MGAELLHADRQTDRQTDMTNLIVAILNFGNTPKNLESNTDRLEVRRYFEENYI
jgi:hypothetical protein